MDPVFRDWTALPQDLLAIIFGGLEIPDLLRSGAVCSSWYAAYSTFRRLRLPSPKQSPCLLYASESCGPDAAALHCPSSGATFHIPMPPGFRLADLLTIGSAHGWLVVADEICNLHLLNPLTGGHVELPPITALHKVEGSVDDDGNLIYTFHDRPDKPPWSAPPGKVRDTVYHRVVLSCSPSAGSACVVLLIHMPLGELSFARIGDERWTWIGDSAGLETTDFHHNAVYSESDGLFYVVDSWAGMHTLDLNGPCPVARKVMPDTTIPDESPGELYRYLISTPWGEILQAWRCRDYLEPPEDENFIEQPEDFVNPLTEFNTTNIHLYKLDAFRQKLVKMDSLPDHALFLGYNDSMCLPIKDFPWLKPDCAYVTDDSLEYINYCKFNKREVGLWSIQNQTLHPLIGGNDPWLNWPPPIWITPALL